MNPDRNLKTLEEEWYRVLFDHFKAEIEDAALRGNKSVTLSWQTLAGYDINPDLADFTLRKPYLSLFAAEEALKRIDVAADPNPLKYVRLVDLPEHARRRISDIRAASLGKLISVDGIVRKITEVRPKVTDAKFQCLKCGAVISVAQQSSEELKEPAYCYEDQGGCGRGTKFKLLDEESNYIDTQKILLQENPEGLRGEPQNLTIYADDDLAGLVMPGDRVTVVGILHGMTRYAGKKKLTTLRKVLDAVSFVHREYAFEEIEVSPEEERMIKEASSKPDIYDLFVQSIAPTIYGMDIEKHALLLQLFGGVPKEMPDGTRIRGDIHILLVGDPSTAKSQLLKSIANIAPRSMFTSGKSSSAAGLTASAVRSDDFGEGKWTLEAGALVLADMGTAIIDEIDKMRPQDRDALHPAMEQQEISIAKAGINATLKTRCAVLAAANPSLGRFDIFKDIVEQINLPSTLLSRFDLIFPITDRPNVERDSRLASHILKVHRIGETRGTNLDSDMIEATDEITPLFDRDFIRKYISFAKTHIKPVLTQEAEDAIKDFYLQLRAASNYDTGIAIAPRQIEAMVRLAEASARVRLSSLVTREDAERAINLMKYYIKMVAMEDNYMDIDKIETGIAHKGRGRLQALEEAIKALEEEYGYASMDKLLIWAKEHGYEEHLEHDLAHMKQMGKLFEPKTGTYKRT